MPRSPKGRPSRKKTTAGPKAKQARKSSMPSKDKETSTPSSKPARFKLSRARNAGPPPKMVKVDATGTRLNKYVAQCGIASRRQAAEYVKAGLVGVNGEVVKEPGYQVAKGDKITYQGKPIRPEERLVYILLNKPRGIITTSNDDRGRDTVIDGFGDKIPERIFSVGRLDRDTSGLLLLTNDGALAKQLTHPSHGVSKIYQVYLDKPLTKKDLERVGQGVELEDGMAEVDWVKYDDPKDRKSVVLELHSGRNRVIRRIFAALGYEVKKLDRTYFAGLTKKDLPRAYYRFLTERELIMLRHFSKPKKKPVQK